MKGEAEGEGEQGLITTLNLTHLDRFFWRVKLLSSIFPHNPVLLASFVILSSHLEIHTCAVSSHPAHQQTHQLVSFPNLEPLFSMSKVRPLEYSSLQIYRSFGGNRWTPTYIPAASSQGHVMGCTRRTLLWSHGGTQILAVYQDTVGLNRKFQIRHGSAQRPGVQGSGICFGDNSHSWEVLVLTLVFRYSQNISHRCVVVCKVHGVVPDLHLVLLNISASRCCSWLTLMCSKDTYPTWDIWEPSETT